MPPSDGGLRLLDDRADCRHALIGDVLCRRDHRDGQIPVLFDKPGRHPGQIGGRSPFLQAVHGQGPENLIGGIADMRITAASQNSLTGELVRAEVQAA